MRTSVKLRSNRSRCELTMLCNARPGVCRINGAWKTLPAKP